MLLLAGKTSPQKMKKYIEFRIFGTIPVTRIQSNDFPWSYISLITM